MWLRINSGQCCMWVEHLGSHFLLCSKGFSLGFPPSTKTDISKSQFEQDRGPARKPGRADVAFPLSIVIYLIF